MTRITPRTCLYPLTGSLLLTFALSIGLTYRSDHFCYAGTCGEWLFPLQARLHVVIWYFWISISVSFLGIRAFHPQLRRLIRQPLFDRKIPLVGKHLAISGVLVVVWILALYGIIVGVWWIRLRDYFVERGTDNGVDEGNGRLAAIALTGHVCDVTMGMVLVPISRHSALASFFKLSVSTTLAFHMLTAYTLFVLVLLHGFLYVSWIPAYNTLSEKLRMVYPVLNPTYLYNEVWPGNASGLGVWRASLIFTGITATIIMCLVFITTLPGIRGKHFNLFYFTHLLTIVAVIVICLHASTMFYCAAPGLAMWLLDWGMRLYELRKRLDGKVVSLGSGWYSLILQLPRHRLDGCACTSPLAHFYIHHAESSIRELHPFTTITHLASQNLTTPQTETDIPIQFLFRKRGTFVSTHPPAKNHAWITALNPFQPHHNPTLQWTDKLASLADTQLSASNVEKSAFQPSQTTLSSQSALIEPHPMADIGLRLEGPYFTPADPSRYHTVICFVAGTGVSGAIAIANAFTALKNQQAGPPSPCAEARSPQSVSPPSKLPTSSTWQRCVIFWSVRADDYVELPFLKDSTSALEFHVHRTGHGRPRLDIDASLTAVCGLEAAAASTWVYLSGPNAFIADGERACKARKGVEWYGARWDI